MERFGHAFDEREKNEGSETGVDRWLKDVYGHGADEAFDLLWKEHPEWTLEQAVLGYEKEPMHHQTDFFRKENLRTIATELVPKIAEKKKGSIEILDIGCSSGEEPYSIGIHMLEAGVQNFSIRGIDVTPATVEEAKRGEYDLWAGSVRELGWSSSKISPNMFEKHYFVDNGKRAGNKHQRLIAEVGPALRERVTFEEHDILEKAYGGEYDVVLMNNILIHYPPKSCDKILRQALMSLRPGGYLVIEPKMYPMNQEEREWLTPYLEWRSHLTDQYPLKEIGTKDNWTEKEMKSGEYFEFLGWGTKGPPVDDQ